MLPVKFLSSFVFLIALHPCASAVLGRNLHVDPVAGSDANDGVAAPTKTIPAAIKLALPGDTIHLKPVVYRDYAGFYEKKGEPGKPITLDGHGAILEGSDPIDPTKWREVSPGLYANEELMPRMDDGMIGRWFFLWNGQMNHMGRTSKGASAPLKKPEDLQPNEWTFVKDPSREKPPSRQIYGTFYLKLPRGKKLEDVSIFAPVRSAGVQMSGKNAHLVIKNLTATHPYNDGFNIHGDCRDVVFENIRAIECGDDGISAHETAEYRVDGFVSISNSTGICDTVAARTSYNRVFIADCLGLDLFFLDDGRYKLSNAIILSSAQNPFTVTGREDKHCELEVDNVLFRRIGPPRPALIATTAVLKGKRLTMENIDFDKRGDLLLQDSLINGKLVPGGAAAGSANLHEILATFGEDMRRAVLQRHSSYLLPRAVHRDGEVKPVITAHGHCAWPNLKLLKDGRTLAAFIFNNDSHGHRPGDVECWISKDHGTAWNLMSAATAHEPETIRMNHAAGLAKNGDLLVLTGGWSNLWPPNVPRTRGGYRYEILAPWLSRSSDNGKTWQVDKQGFPHTTPSGQTGTPFGDVVRAHNGDLCVSIYGTQAPWEKYEERRFRSWLYRSRDDGLTWGEPVVIGPDSNETNILHLGEGRWLACARGGTGVEKKDFMELYGSTDDGRTWTKKRAFPGFQRVNGHLLKLKSGDILFTYGDRASAPGRRGLEAMRSEDNGETWSEPIRLIDWNGLDGGYPSCVQRSDGHIITAYYSSALPDQSADSMKGYHMAVITWNAETSFARAAAAPATFTDLAYGEHTQQKMDVWLAQSGKPSPLVFYIHGGGWAAYDKSDIHGHLDVRAWLKAGISVASINYRHLQDANAAKIYPPVKWPLEDAARALQFVRTKADEWHIDKARIAATGVSAGGAASLWLAFQKDMADPQSSDPVAQESTRVMGAAGKSPVVTLDPKEAREWIPNAIFGAHAFGYAELSRAASFAPFLAARESHLAEIQRYSPYAIADKDAAPVFMVFPNQDKPPVPGEEQTDPSHSAISGVMMERKLKELGTDVQLRWKDDGRSGHFTIQEYLTELLTKP